MGLHLEIWQIKGFTFSTPLLTQNRHGLFSSLYALSLGREGLANNDTREQWLPQQHRNCRNRETCVFKALNEVRFTVVCFRERCNNVY